MKKSPGKGSGHALALVAIFAADLETSLTAEYRISIKIIFKFI